MSGGDSRITLRLGEKVHTERHGPFSSDSHLANWCCSRYNRHLKDDRERNAASAGIEKVSEGEYLFTPARWYKDSLYANARPRYVKETPVVVTIEPGETP